MLFVGYYRVSTASQGASGLGIEGQQEAVNRFASSRDGTIVEEFIEVESGKLDARPELCKALAVCRLKNATLLVAKLDRLSRNVAFLSKMMESKVKFIACDNPEANELTLHILAAVAQAERKAISERTKAALQAAKARGKLLGFAGRPPEAARAAGGRGAAKAGAVSGAVRSAAVAGRAHDLAGIVADLRDRGAVTVRAIGAGLEAAGIPAARGGKWSPSAVKRLLDLIDC